MMKYSKFSVTEVSKRYGYDLSFEDELFRFKRVKNNKLSFAIIIIGLIGIIATFVLYLFIGKLAGYILGTVSLTTILGGYHMSNQELITKERIVEITNSTITIIDSGDNKIQYDRNKVTRVYSETSYHSKANMVAVKIKIGNNNITLLQLSSLEKEKVIHDAKILVSFLATYNFEA